MNDLTNITPKLPEIKKENPFKVPENYFDSFPSRLQEKIGARQPNVFKHFLYLLKPQLALAVAIIGFALLTHWAYKFTFSHKATETASFNQSILPQDLITIIKNSPSEYDDDLLINNINTSDLDQKNTLEEESELINYLIDEDIEYTTLIAQL